MSSAMIISRRRMLAMAGAAAGVVAGGCSPRAPEEATGAPNGPRQPDGPRLVSMTVFRDPSCGCCEAWGQLASDAGFDVALRDDPDMPAVKQRLGVPPQLASCHTALVGGFVIEGHVPFEQVQRLIRTRPAGVKGIAVPGMPAGSPGMEMPDGRRDPFQTFSFDAAGRTAIFA